MNSRKEIFSIVYRFAKTVVCGASAAFITGCTLLFASNLQTGDTEAQLQIGSKTTSFVVEIKAYASSNRQNDIDPAEGQLVWTRGDYFVVDGTIYPDGSIARGSGKEPDPNATQLGRYVQRGVFTSELDQFEKAVAGVTDVDSTVGFVTEILVFKDGSTILMDGLWPNAYFSVNRVVLGGTGRFRDVVGEVFEENIGEDTDGFCNLRMTFNIRKAARFGAQDR